MIPWGKQCYLVAILEYNGVGRWMYPNPVVMRSEAFKRALNKLQLDQSAP